MNTLANQLSDLHNSIESFKNKQDEKITQWEEEKGKTWTTALDTLSEKMDILCKSHARPTLVPNKSPISSGFFNKSWGDYEQECQDLGYYVMSGQRINKKENLGGNFFPSSALEPFGGLNYQSVAPIFSLARTFFSTGHDVFVSKARAADAIALGDDRMENPQTLSLQKIPLRALSLKRIINKNLIEHGPYSIVDYIQSDIHLDMLMWQNLMMLQGDDEKTPQGLTRFSADRFIDANIPDVSALTRNDLNTIVGQCMEKLTPESYVGEVSWLMSTHAFVRLQTLMVPGETEWTSDQKGDTSLRFKGYRVYVTHSLPAHCDIIFGNFEKAYTVARNPKMQVFANDFNYEPDKSIMIRTSVGGALVDERHIAAVGRKATHGGFLSTKWDDLETVKKIKGSEEE